tara:strand:- start:146 stop:622 length:477 start_codon:yes stop_codon:yes gene_type:complete
MKINKLKIIIFISIIFLIFFTPISFAEVKANKSVDVNKKSINSIDLSKEQKNKLIQIQKEFKNEFEKINSSFIEKRKELNQLVEKDASNDELQNKIKEITSLKSKQLWLLIRNKKSLERLLGKDKNQEFMTMARKKFHEHNKKYNGNFPPVPISPPSP